MKPEDDTNLDCAWQTGGSYYEPPSYCDLEKDTSDDEHCPIHKEGAAALEALELSVSDD